MCCVKRYILVQLDPEKDPSQDGKTGGIYQYVARDEYGLSLHYFQGDYGSISGTQNFLLDVPAAYYGGYDLFNGNIRAMNNTLRTGSTSEPLLQVFGYDQLNRIGSSRSYIQNAVAASITDWNPSASLTDMFRTLYNYDANGNIQELHRYDKAGVQFDRLSYGYTAGSNRLDHVSDAIADGVVNYDIDNNDPGNYGYDAIGNLTRDVKEEIDTISWNVYGKVTKVIRSSGSSRADLYFGYDGSGRRISKRVVKPGGEEWTENYVLDAQGNVLGIYKVMLTEDEENPVEVHLNQNVLYGSSRLGLWERNKKLTFTPVTETIQSVHRGDKRYELSDHLGNVHVVLTDRKELHCGLEDNVAFPEYYTAEVKNRYDYYPFGMLMEERKYGASVCRYDIDTSFIATVMDQNFEEDPTLDAWLYVISSATPNYGSGSMLLDYDQDPLITYWPADEGDRYKVTFSFSFEGDCDSLQVLGNVQNSTTQSYTSGGTYTFDFTVNDVSGGYGVFGFYKDNPDCIVYIHWVKIEQYTTSTQVVCDTDSVAGYRYGFNGQEKIDEQYGIEGTAFLFEYRVYDSRIGRFLSVDPLFKEYSWNSVYAFAENDVIRAVDIEGLEKAIVIQFSYRGVYYRSTVIRVPNGSKKNVSNPDGILYQRLDITNFNRAEIENEIRTFKQLAKIPSGVTDVALNDPKYDRDIQEGFSNRAEEVAYEGVVNANADSRNIFPLGVINVEFPTCQLPRIEYHLKCEYQR